MRSITISAFIAVALVSSAAMKVLMVEEGMVKAALLVDQLPMSQSALACTRRNVLRKAAESAHRPQVTVEHALVVLQQ